MDTRSKIIKPLISEQSMIDAQNGKYTFAVGITMGKNEVRKVITEQFSVEVVGVKTSNRKGKKRRFGLRRTEVASTPWKKAVVKLKAGQKINLFDLGGEHK